MAGETKHRPAKTETLPPPTAPPAPEPKKEKPTVEVAARVPFLLDFYPLEDERSTQLSRFYESLKDGRLTTTRCAKDGVHWPPRLVCP
ncbi:MAG: zinc ribbon domain-containing protein, partial [Thermoplasmata archaeon]|nr:zinc ribbon domain-containing protein [Thermoplasmata archaeon]